MLRRSDENKKDYIKRIRDSYGIFFDKNYIEKTAFEYAKYLLLQREDINPEYRKVLIRLYFGGGEDKALALAERFKNRGLISKERFSQIKDHLRRTYKRVREGYYCFSNFWKNRGSEKGMLFVDKNGEYSFFCENTLVKDYMPVTELDMVGDQEKVKINGLLYVRDVKFIEDIIKDLNSDRESLYDPDYIIFHPEFRRRMNTLLFYRFLKVLGVNLKGYKPLLSMALGTMEIRPIDLAIALAKLIKGPNFKAYIIDRIEDESGRLIYKTDLNKRQNGKKLCNIDILLEMMHGVATYGTAPFLNRIEINQNPSGILQTMPKGRLTIKSNNRTYQLWAGGKTGTTNDYTDAWFNGVFLLPLHPPPLDKNDLWNGVVWVGQNSKSNKLVNHTLKVYGSTSARLWSKISRIILKNRLNEIDLADWFDSNIVELKLEKSGESVMLDPSTGSIISASICIPEGRYFCREDDRLKPIRFLPADINSCFDRVLDFIKRPNQ